MKSIKWNLNHHVGIYWNEWCSQVYREHYADIALDASPFVPTPDEDGLVWLQAHALMRIFGPHVTASAGNRLSMVCRIEVTETDDDVETIEAEESADRPDDFVCLATTMKEDLFHHVGHNVSFFLGSDNELLASPLLHVGDNFVVAEANGRKVRIPIGKIVAYEVMP